ncbi:MAG: o-succinylbenzoate synthase [Actinomycetota bacterium]
MSRIRDIELCLIGLPLVRPFRTSFGIETDKACVLVRVETDGAVGWGECVAGRRPDYSEEFNEDAWLTLRDHLGPAVLGEDVRPEDVAARTAWVRGHRMAKAALEMAVLDAWLRERDRSLASHLGAERDRVPCGVSIGITPTTGELLEQVGGYLAEGYRRIKLKIEPGTDVERVAAVREAHPEIQLSVDANAAYTIEDADTMRALEPYELLMIEQPLSHEDIVEHANLQRMLRTPICLDESIRSAADAAAALELGACRIVNIKQGRVGGLLESRRIHDLALAREAPVWCGGMLETGIGRAANLALAALPGFTLPGDTSASARYFEADVTEPFVMEPDGTMAVPVGPGLGVEPLPDRLAEITTRTERLEG